MQKSKAKILQLPKKDSGPSSEKTPARSAAKKTREAKPPLRRDHYLRSVPDTQSKQPQPEAASAKPVFKRCLLRGPDGLEREGWELHLDGIMIGRAESKKSLHAYYVRLSEPLSSQHWRDTLLRPRRGPIAPDREKEHNANAAQEAEQTEQESKKLHVTG